LPSDGLGAFIETIVQSDADSCEIGAAFAFKAPSGAIGVPVVFKELV
jgi:hypothetical protein